MVLGGARRLAELMEAMQYARKRREAMQSSAGNIGQLIASDLGGQAVVTHTQVADPRLLALLERIAVAVERVLGTDDSEPPAASADGRSAIPGPSRNGDDVSFVNTARTP